MSWISIIMEMREKIKGVGLSMTDRVNEIDT